MCRGCTGFSILLLLEFVLLLLFNGHCDYFSPGVRFIYAVILDNFSNINLLLFGASRTMGHQSLGDLVYETKNKVSSAIITLLPYCFSLIKLQQNIVEKK